MTIIEPKKAKSKIKFLLIPIMLIIFSGGFLSISIHNDTVELKHQLANFEGELQKMKVSNAELKNKLYSLLEVEKLKDRTGELSLVLDRKPRYLEFDNDELATR